MIIDSYSFRARFLPAAIAIVPVVGFCFISLSWSDISVPELGIMSASSVLLVTLSDLSRRLGRSVEKKIFAESGGRPNISVLRLDDITFDPLTKKRYRQFLSEQLNEAEPDGTQEPDENGFLERCGHWLRERTRDKNRFHLIFEENVTYGFRRNLYGLKKISLLISLAVIVGGTYFAGFGSPFSGDGGRITHSVVVLISLMHAAYFAIFVTRKSVLDASEAYARQLALSCETLMAER
ncbi:hypothetical protein [Thalassospira tepidiphila]|uniref:SMODS and SLOG-associating 2TM effector domain-containing protein n=1 Tax=Thalassospira tepidiphila TaxID=393657 RepID=A0ABX0WYE9_9PROT|nr:hypothetical protein [Thalassospira tepidiphila]NJB74357.1 hypothetical protein [Thalassospira tepidiphila]